jgi:cobalt-precorrin-7 (C5)-methyltransferase
MTFDTLSQTPITIIGCGPAGPEYLTPLALDIINKADLLIGSKRLLSIYGNSNVKKIEITSKLIALLSEIDELIQNQLQVTVLVTGDTGAASLTATLIKRFGKNKCRCIPGISSIQLACARLGIDWIETQIINAHKGIPSISIDTILSNNRIIVLGGNPKSWSWVLSIVDLLELTHSCYRCVNLGLNDETISPIKYGDCKSLPEGGGNAIFVWQRKDNE